MATGEVLVGTCGYRYYDYEYDDDELDDLAGTLADRAADRDRVYCLFNNYEMYPNARALQRRLDG